MKKITIEVAPDGAITLEADGFPPGEDCVKETGPLEEALGMTPDDRTLKTEYYETECLLETIS